MNEPRPFAWFYGGRRASSHVITNRLLALDVVAIPRRVTGSVSSPTVDHSAQRFPEDQGVEGEVPVLYVAQVEPDGLFPRQVTAAADLPEAGEPRLDQQSTLRIPPVDGDFLGQ